jgi:hypothetical protein
MSDRGTPLTGLYSFAAACGLFAAAYGALDLVPSPAMALLLGWGPAIAIAPPMVCLAFPWPCRLAPGRAAMRERPGPLGFIAGATLRFFLVA